jgi:hypothetical protein
MKKIIISLDFEMMWGVHHIYQNKIEEVKKFFLKTPYIVSETLRMFKERDISATWAIVGALFMNDWHEYEKNNYYYRYDKKILNFNNNFKIKMVELFSEHGVADHGKQSIELIAREKHLSNFELYPTNIINEVDCISIRESLIAGCIPLIANFGIFNERDGLKFDINHEDPKILKRTALLILNLLKDKPKLDEIRESFKKSSTICSWDQIYNIWYNIINKKN